MAKIITLPFKPHPYQQILANLIKRFSVFVCHRRFGKSTLMVNLLLKWALAAKRRNWRGAYIAPFRSQAKDIAWDYLQFYSQDVPGRQINISELKIDFPNGARIKLLGADYPDSLRGPYWDVVVFDEYAQIRPNCYKEIIRPALVDRKGWAIFIGTPKGHNHFYDLWEEFSENRKKSDPEYAAIMYKASQTQILDPEELEKTRQQLSLQEYEQEFECSFEAALVGAYYGEQMQDSLVQGRITNVPYEPILPVHTAWDLGVDDETCIWFFQLSAGGEIRIIDYEHGSNQGIDAYIRILKDKKYIYGQHLLPHDAKAREMSTGRSIQEFAYSLGLDFDVVPIHNISDGIQAVRSILPRCWFNEETCKDGIEALKTYRKEYSDKLVTFKDRPYHDWSSHGADAFRYLAMGLELIKPQGPVLKLKMPTLRLQRQANGWML